MTQKKIKIVIAVEAIPPYCGGGEQVAWMHAMQLARYEDVSLITFGEDFKTEFKNGIKIYFLKKQKHQFAYYLTNGKNYIKKYLQEIRPDIIHCHMPYILSMCINKNKSLMISTIHDGVPENKIRELEHRSFFQYLKIRFLRKINIFRSDFLTCVSHHNCSLMKNLYKYKKDKFITIPNGIDNKFLQPIRTGVGDYILNFGRQIDLKMGALIETAKIMPNVNFKFIGSGPMVSEYGLKNVEFLGFKSDFIEYIDNAAICVFPSKSENFPLVGLEAMARGKPVIATKTGFSEYIKDGENGVLLEDNNPIIIKNAIEALLKDKALYSELAKKARSTAELFSFDKIASIYRCFYNRILSDPNISMDSIQINH